MASETTSAVDVSPAILEEKRATITNSIKHIVPSNILDRTANGILNAFVNHKFPLSGVDDCDLLGSKYLAKTSKGSYFKHYSGMFKFLSLIGDYESLLVLYVGTPRELVPSMKAESVALYLLYKCSKKGDVLKLYEDSPNVTNVYGHIVSCLGEWKAIVNVHQCLSAVSALHSSLKFNSVNYQDLCNSCVNDFKVNNHSTGCIHHRGKYHFYRQGNPRLSDVVSATYRRCKDLLCHHKVKSCYQLTPQEVHQIRSKLLSGNSKEDLQLYCTILVAIYLFLRYDDVYRIETTKFLPGYSTFNPDGSVKTLCFEVKGKNDREVVQLLLRACDEIPELCAVRHLLIYIYMQHYRRLPFSRLDG
jgi:hypothetical protein